MKVINLFAGPGAGKSTTAAGLFHLMKVHGLNVELVTEYAKDMTWEERHNILADQFYVFAKQNRRQSRLRGKVDFIITDSPLLLCAHYGAHLSRTFHDFIREVWESYDNVNFFIKRVKPYSAVGRSQDEAGARKIDVAVQHLLHEEAVSYRQVLGNESAPRVLMDKLGYPL